MSVNLFHTTRALVLLGAFVAMTACSKNADGSAADPGKGNVAQSGAPGAASGAGAAGGRGSQSMSLASTDVATIAPTSIEAGTALTGDLRPIETIDVRSRLEGELQTVLVREGQQGNAGQLLAQFEATEQESTRKSAGADRAPARADLSNAEWTYEQDASLFKAGAIAQRDFKNAEQAVATARARLAAAEARLSASSNQARDTRVIAPSAGVVDKKTVESGEHVAK